MSQIQVRQRYNFRHQKPSLYEDAVQTVTYFQRLKEEEPAFAEHFEEWRDHREVTIDTIRDLQNRMDVVCVGTNVAQCVGAAAGIVGIISGLAGVVLEANKDESADDFKKFGKYCAGAGAAVVMSSTLLEAGLNQNVINKINRILEKDVELTQPLKKWIQFSKEVNDCLNRLFQCNMTSITFTNVIKVCRHCVQMLTYGNVELQDLLLRLQTGRMEGIGNVPLEVMQKAYHSLSGIEKNPGLLKPLGEICRMIQQTPLTFDFAKSGVEIYQTASEIMEPLTMMLSVTDCIAGCSILARCALDTIAIGSHIVKIIFSIKKIKEAKSEYSESLDQVRSALCKELMEITMKMQGRVQRSSLNYQNIPRIGY